MSVPDVSILRRILFSVAHLPRNTPHFWKLVSDFSFRDLPANACTDTENIRVLVENLHFIDSS